MAHLTEAQVADFEEQGYLVVRGLFDPEEDLDPVIEEYAGVLDRLACQLFETETLLRRTMTCRSGTG